MRPACLPACIFENVDWRRLISISLCAHRLREQWQQVLGMEGTPSLRMHTVCGRVVELACIFIKRGLLCGQAASGAGQAAMDELEQQTREVLDGKPPTQNIFPFQVGDPGTLMLTVRMR